MFMFALYFAAAIVLIVAACSSIASVAVCFTDEAPPIMAIGLVLVAVMSWVAVFGLEGVVNHATGRARWELVQRDDGSKAWELVDVNPGNGKE